MVADAARISAHFRRFVTQPVSARASAPCAGIVGNFMIRKRFANSIDRIRENFATIS
jgi:hypothetical protein